MKGGNLMKKLLIFLMASFIVLLAACADSSSTDSTETESEENAEATDNNEDTDTSEDTDSSDAESNVSLEEVYKKAIERQNEINSMSTEIVMDQKMVFDESGETSEMNSNMNLTADFTMDPVASYMKGTITTFDPLTEENMEMNTEMYMLEDAFYMYDSNSDAWLQLPLEGMESVLGQSTKQLDANEQLKQLESIISEFTIHEEGDEYILTLDVAGDKFTEFVIEQMQLLGSVGITEADEDIVEIVKYDKVNYVLKINKDTYDMTALDLVMHMTIEEDDESVMLEIDSKMTYSNINGIDKIEVPQDVIDNAVNLEL